jgi:anti-anti-sigma factor
MPDFRPLVVRLQDAEWDLSTCEKLRFLLIAATNQPRVVIDLSAVTFMDATCLGKLAGMQRERLGKAGLLPAALVVAYPPLRRLFTLVGFEHVWPIFSTLDEALAGDSPHDDVAYKPAM